ncbi:uncharacterized protein LOC142538336 [Primulina tabacum]|uniref:uncharacterized protein LOC142538336 n=1 Tax=Primulina tabacum TaxID=48773 RepID=UPI003F59A7AF
MAPLQRIKMLATTCTVARSPTRSPITSQVIPLRRRTTLRMLLGHGDGDGGRTPPKLRYGRSPDRMRDSGEGRSREKGKSFSVSRKLKDFFVSSPPGPEDRVAGNARKRSSPTSGGGFGGGISRCGARTRRPPAATFRQRLLRRAWRPLLVAIPE